MNAVTQSVRTVAEHTAFRGELRALEHAHAAAKDFHGAMENAFWWQRDIEDYERDLRNADGFEALKQCARDQLPEARKNYAQALGEAAAALQKMPSKWAAVLSCELDAMEKAS